MPVLVANASDIPSLLQRLEAHRLANPDTALQFVLLSDFADADAEDMPTDDDITHALVSGVDELNKRYQGARGGGPIHLLHPPRLYNDAQESRMGWARKRGKLEQFNAYLLPGIYTPFHVTAVRHDYFRTFRLLRPT